MPTPTPDKFANASADVTGSFANSMELAPILVFLVYALGVLMAAQFVAPWAAQSELLSKVGHGIGSTIHYALKGAAATAVIGVAALPVWFVWQLDGAGQGVALRYIGYGVAAFAGLAVFGWLADRAVSKFIKAHPDLDEWGDLFPESDDEAESEPTPAD